MTHDQMTFEEAKDILLDYAVEDDEDAWNVVVNKYRFRGLVWALPGTKDRAEALLKKSFRIYLSRQYEIVTREQLKEFIARIIMETWVSDDY